MEFNVGDKVMVVNPAYLGNHHSTLIDVVKARPDKEFKVVEICEYPSYSGGVAQTCVVIQFVDKQMHVPISSLGPITPPYSVDQWSID